LPKRHTYTNTDFNTATYGYTFHNANTNGDANCQPNGHAKHHTKTNPDT
jgi:hypothetical protein